MATASAEHMEDQTAMDDLFKDRIRRALATFDIRIQKCKHLKYPFDRVNFSGTADNATIFDVGGNIGQSSIWFLHEFPKASIYCFEPFAAIYQQLLSNTARFASIKTFHFGMSSKNEKRTVDRIDDYHCTTGKTTRLSSDESAEEIHLRTIDSFCAEEGIGRIDILKTDTEGHDIHVLRGAVGMLRQHCIANVLSEASIRKESNDQTNFFDLCDFLGELGYELFSMYDLRHDIGTGRLNYFNVLFKPTDSVANVTSRKKSMGKYPLKPRV